MKKATKDIILRQLKTAQDEFDMKIQMVADNLRTAVIIPVCKRYNMEFFSGNGVYFFTTNNGKQVSDGMMLTNEDDRYDRALKPVFELLNEEVSLNKYLGYYVSDVKKKDY